MVLFSLLLLLLLLLLLGSLESSSYTLVRAAVSSDGCDMEKSSAYFLAGLNRDPVVCCLFLRHLRTSQKRPESKRTAPRPLATPIPTNPPADMLSEFGTGEVTLGAGVESDGVPMGTGVEVGRDESVVDRSRISEE